jgi:hypothetical protein
MKNISIELYGELRKQSFDPLNKELAQQLIGKALHLQLNIYLQKTERKAHPSECVWDVSDQYYM